MTDSAKVDTSIYEAEILALTQRRDASQKQVDAVVAQEIKKEHNSEIVDALNVAIEELQEKVDKIDPPEVETKPEATNPVT